MVGTPQELFDRLVEHGKDTLLKQEELTLMIHAVGNDGDFVVAIPGGIPPAARAVVYEALRQMFSTRGVTHYGACAECWMARLDKEEVRALDHDGIAPSERPDRIECLSVVVVAQGQLPLVTLMEIKRHEGRVVGFGDNLADLKHGFGGPMFELLEPAQLH